MALHPSAANVLGERNIAFLHGPDHKALRRSFIALFTRRALGVRRGRRGCGGGGGTAGRGDNSWRLKDAADGRVSWWGCWTSRTTVPHATYILTPTLSCPTPPQVYVSKQDQIICDHLRKWVFQQGGSDKHLGFAQEMRDFVRALNAWTSQEVFAGEGVGVGVVLHGAFWTAGWEGSRRGSAGVLLCRGSQLARVAGACSMGEGAHLGPEVAISSLPAGRWIAWAAASMGSCLRGPLLTPSSPTGPYLDDAETRTKFSKAYMAMTEAFLGFPLCVPGTAVWKGYKGRLYIIEVRPPECTCDMRARGLRMGSRWWSLPGQVHWPMLACTS